MGAQKKSANVLLSKPVAAGPFWHFNMRSAIPEIQFDHDSDHVQGLLMIEAMRQAAIASTHLHGLPLSGMITLLHMNTRFIKFLDKKIPQTLRAYAPFLVNPNCLHEPRTVVVELFQWGKLCASAQIEGTAFPAAGAYRQFIDRTEKIRRRVQNNFSVGLASCASAQEKRL